MIVNRENLTRRLERVFPFNMVEADQIARLAEQSEVVYFKKGDVIYSEGAGAQYLYIVFEGQVEILKEKSHSLLRKNLLRVGDAFGEDVLSERNRRKTSARALEDTLLIRIALPVLTRFIQRNQELRRYFQFLADSYHGLLSIDQDIDLDGETVHYIGQPHKIFLITRAVFFLIFMLLAGCAVQYLSWTGIISTNITMWAFIFLFGSYSLWLLWNIAEWSNDIFIFTNRRVICLDRGLFLYESREETPMDAIVSLTSQANVLGRQYGFGDLSIKTFTGLLQLKNLPQISAAQKLLEFLIEQNHLYQQREEEHDFENLLRSRAGLKVEQPTEENAEQSSSDQGDTSGERAGGFFSNRLGMRQCDGRVVVYRTHWLFLFRKTFLPFLVFVILILLLALMHAKAPMILGSIIVKSIMVVLTLLVLGWWLYQFIDWRNDQYIITPDQLIDVYRRPLGLEDKRTAPLESIQSIRYKRRGVLGLVFNFGTVFVKVGNEDFTFDNIHNPLEVQQTLFGYLEKANLLEKQANLVDQRRQMADWMDTYQRFSKEHPDSSDEQDK